ncbi:DMT family transporter [Spirosoma gilvum]
MIQQNTLSWLCLIGAAICQMSWTYSLKFIQITALKTLCWSSFYQLSEGWLILGPWLSYIVFGAVNSVLLSVAMRTIPTATAFAVWMALSLVFIKIGDIVLLKTSWSFAELFSIGGLPWELSV